MGGGSRVRHQRSAVANIIADVDQLQRIQQAMRFLAPPAHIEGEDRAASAHLPHGQFMLRMTGETGMQYFVYPDFKEFPQGKRIRALLPVTPEIGRVTGTESGWQYV